MAQTSSTSSKKNDTFDSFAAEGRESLSGSRRPVLTAVDKKGSNNHQHQHHDYHHSGQRQLFSLSLGPVKTSRSARAGRLHSVQLSSSKSEGNDESSLDPFRISDSAVQRGSGGGGGGGDTLELLPMSLEQRLEAAQQTGQNISIVLDPQTARQQRNNTNNNIRATNGGSVPKALPPKMSIKLTLYEEVSSMSLSNELVAAQTSIEGSAYVQVQCSDALKNAPFCIGTVNNNNSNHNSNVTLRPNPQYTSLEPIYYQRYHRHEEKNNDSSPSLTSDAASKVNDSLPLSSAYLVQVPKSELSYVPVIHYSLAQVMDHMPVLLERKVTVHEASSLVRIALQVRSKLSNRGDLRDFTLAVAVPEVVDGDSVTVVRGQGLYDKLKRLIKFTLPFLDKGESFMVCAQAKLWQNMATDEVRFPVLMRCSSTEDQISSVDFHVQEADGAPCSISVVKAYSFRLLHRLT